VLAYAESELERLARLKELRAAQEYPLENRSLVVLTRGTDSSPAMIEAHAILAKLSRNHVTRWCLAPATRFTFSNPVL
jgi:hypothetical protein